MIRGVLLSVLLLCTPAWAQAATYYLDNAGSNANAGTSTGAPWLTWSHAFANSDCGDTLVVMDGTYIIAKHGPFSLAKVCTASTIYTIRAQNERAAFISSDGTARGIFVLNSAYITIEGLRVKSVDFSGGSQYAFSNVHVHDSNHITFRRMLVSNNNRYYNTHLLQLTNSPYSLVEESEFYYFARHAILVNKSSNDVIRRNYCNSRSYDDIAGGYPSGGSTYGDNCIVVYPGSNNIIENNISEGALLKFAAVEALGAATDNVFYGNIARGADIGIDVQARGDTATFMPRNTIIKNFVAINVEQSVRSLGAKNTHCDNCSVIDGGVNGLIASYQQAGDGIYSFFSDNSLVQSVTGTGFNIHSSVDTWLIRYSNSYGNGTNYAPSAITKYLPTTTPESSDPKLGSCRVWIPDMSPMKRAGLNGADIGANILYRYRNGVLTNIPLWNPTTGEFPRGAIVAGLNDVAGNSLFDVHKRLNVNTNGCSFPANYGNGVTDVDAPSTPEGLRLF